MTTTGNPDRTTTNNETTTAQQLLEAYDSAGELTMLYLIAQCPAVQDENIDWHISGKMTAPDGTRVIWDNGQYHIMNPGRDLAGSRKSSIRSPGALPRMLGPASERNTRFCFNYSTLDTPEDVDPAEGPSKKEVAGILTDLVAGIAPGLTALQGNEISAEHARSIAEQSRYIEVQAFMSAPLSAIPPGMDDNAVGNTLAELFCSGDIEVVQNANYIMTEHADEIAEHLTRISEDASPSADGATYRVKKNPRPTGLAAIMPIAQLVIDDHRYLSLERLEWEQVTRNAGHMLEFLERSA